MKLGIMQPYFFPYIGYYDLINRTDRWVVFDVVKYSPKSWMNRNRILHPNEGWQYVTVPVDKHTATGTISEVNIVNKIAAHRRIIGQIEHYRKKRAPFFEAARDLVDRAFDLKTDKLAELDIRTLALVCEYLGIDFQYTVLSEANLALGPIDHPGSWALEIATAMRATEYINPPNGRGLFRPEEFEERGIRLSFTDVIDYKYDCKRAAFVGRLSILDAIMWNEPASIRAFLDARKHR